MNLGVAEWIVQCAADEPAAFLPGRMHDLGDPTHDGPASQLDIDQGSWLQRVAPFPLADGSSASSRRPSGVRRYSSPPDRTGAVGVVSVSGTALPLRRQDARPVSASKRPARSPDSVQ